MIDDEGVEAFFSKAEAREPVLRAAQGFVPVEGRPVFKAWVGLLAELRECAFELSDPRVTALKAGWWAEELDGMARGAARHPLGRLLLAHGVPAAPAAFAAAAGALPVVAGETDPTPDLDAAVGALLPFAQPLADIESSLFGVSTGLEGGRALAVHWLRHRLERGQEAPDRARIPLAAFARHGLRRERLASADAEADALRREWAGELLGILGTRGPGGASPWPFPGLLRWDTDRRALARHAAGRGHAPRVAEAFGNVYRAWRLARNAALQPRVASRART